MTEHWLKCWTPFFQAVSDGRKPFEVRRDDRAFQTGDTVLLMETDPITKQPTGSQCRQRITYVLRGGQFGIKPGFVVLGFGRVSP